MLLGLKTLSGILAQHDSSLWVFISVRQKLVIELQSQNIANGSRTVVGVNSKSNKRDPSDQFGKK